MNNEENRLNTFGSWPTSAAIEPIRIAKAGFFYTGRGVEVQCFSCGGKISEWSYGDQVMARHRRLDPRCPFVVDPASSGNVALVLGRPCARSSNSAGSTRDNSLNVANQRSTEDSNPLEVGGTLNNDDEIYRNDALRLLSFINWPVRFISRESLASAGFYHAGGGRVRCAWCGGELCGGWRHGDRPLEEHRRHFPHCEYARLAGATVAPDVRQLSPETPPVGSPQGDAPPHTSEAVEHNCRVLEGLQWRGLGVVGGGAEGARHPARASLASRLATYNNWPSARRQTPALLAEAGFYYTGSEDQVRCFYCDGGLGKWEPSDAPWSEHARWFPDCGYVQLVKGREFIERSRYRAARDYTIEEEPPAPRRSEVRNRVQFPISEDQVESAMESTVAIAALCTGLDAARVRAAIRRRLRITGVPFTSSEALIDAALNEQLNEETWSMSPGNQRLARDILSETLRSFTTVADVWDERMPASADERSVSPADSLTAAISPAGGATENKTPEDKAKSPAPPQSPTGSSTVSLEEENRQLKEARLCKVCMDCEVSVVFLPCGHLVSCGACGASLAACPLCRAAVRALVRAYLA